MTALGTRLLTLSVDGVERNAECSVTEILSAETDSDFVTFADAAAGGGRDYVLHIVAVQDAAADTLFDIMWTATGTSVPVIVRPYGNAVASASQPHYTGNVVITEPDGVMAGGEANASTSARFTFEVEWAFEARPVKVVAP